MKIHLNALVADQANADGHGVEYSLQEAEKMDSKNLNPRYVSYAKAHGKTPEKMLEHDKKKYPGGSMCGFILWMAVKHRKCATEHKHIADGRRIFHQTKWTEYLEQEAEKDFKQSSTRTTSRQTEGEI